MITTQKAKREPIVNRVAGAKVIRPSNWKPIAAGKAASKVENDNDSSLDDFRN